MLNWLSKRTPEGRLQIAAREIEAELIALGIQWVQADHEVKLAAGALMMDTMQRLIPDYDFSRNIHVQFFDYVRNKPADLLEQSAQQFSKISAAARVENPSLCIVMGTVGQLFSLFAVNVATKRDETRTKTGSLYTAHSRAANDIIQYVLYHRAVDPSGMR